MIGCAQAATLNERWHLTEPFKLIFRTTGAAETVTIPCQNAGVFRAWIDWGDGSAKSEITAYNSAKLAHVYAVAGDYTVSITGSFPGIKFNNAGDKDKLREVVAWGKTNFKNLSWAFQGCTNMTSAAADGGGSTIANVVSLQNTFWGCSVFDGPIGNWNIGNVQTLYLTFSRTPFNQDISTWDTKNVTDMTGVFYINSVFNRDISAWNLSKTRSTSYMFCASSAFNQNIAAWDVGNVINMVGMFYNSSAFNQNIAAWDVGNVINMATMFYNSFAFNQNIAAWDVGNVINMDAMFLGATVFNQDLSDWCVGHIPSEPATFGNAGTNPVWGTCPYYTTNPVTYVGSATGTTTTGTLPAHQAGDVLVALAFRSNSTTNPTLASGWTVLTNTTDGTSCSVTIGYQIATSSSMTSGTWANATGLVVMVYRGADSGSPVSFQSNSGTGTTVTYPANTGWSTPQGWTICFAGHSAVDTALETPPVGLTLRASFVDATNEIAAFDSNGPTAGFSAEGVAVGGTSNNWLAITLRLKPVLTHI